MPLITRSDLERIGVRVAGLIRARTARGVGEDGRPFAPLADGRPSRLRRTGRLLASLRVQATADGVRVAPTVDYAAAVDAERPFMGLPADEQRTVDAELLAALDRGEAEHDRKRRRR